MMTLRSHLTPIGAPAVWALRAHWVTTVLLTGAVAGALVALLPVSALITGSGAELLPRVAAPAVRIPDLQLPTSAQVTTPATVRSAATLQLFQLLLLVAVGVFLVAACSVLAVAAARAAARTNELTVRRAVGASRRVLFAAALLESGAIAAAALALGGGVGFWGGRLAAAAWPGRVAPGTPGVSVVVVLATVALLAAGVVWPVTATRRRTPLGGRKGRALELVFPALQLGVSLTVLAAASLLGRHANRLEGAAVSHAADGQVFEITVPGPRSASRAGAYAELLRRLGGRPGERAASLTSPGALVGLGTGDGVLTDCGQCAWGGVYVPFRLPYVTHYLISADTFGTLGLPVIAGRGLTDADAWAAPRVVVVSRSLATDDFQQGLAVGRRIQIGHAPATWYTVIGVVADQLPTGFGSGLQPPYAVYLSVLQHPAHAVDLLVRAPHARELVADVSRTVHATLGPGVTVAHESEARRVAREAAPIRWFSRLFGAEGWMMLAIATLGTFVVMWLWVASLSHDLAVRRAVGARRRDVFRYVLTRALGVAAGGVAFGLWCGESLWGTLTTIVAGLPPWEPPVLLRYALLLAAAAVAGALLPAWRAARTAPAVLIGQGDG